MTAREQRVPSFRAGIATPVGGQRLFMNPCPQFLQFNFAGWVNVPNSRQRPQDFESKVRVADGSQRRGRYYIVCGD